MIKLVKSLQKNGHHQEVLNTLAPYLAAHPSSAAALTHLADSHYALGETAANASIKHDHWSQAMQAYQAIDFDDLNPAAQEKLTLIPTLLESLTQPEPAAAQRPSSATPPPLPPAAFGPAEPAPLPPTSSHDDSTGDPPSPFSGK